MTQRAVETAKPPHRYAASKLQEFRGAQGECYSAAMHHLTVVGAQSAYFQMYPAPNFVDRNWFANFIVSLASWLSIFFISVFSPLVFVYRLPFHFCFVPPTLPWDKTPPASSHLIFTRFFYFFLSFSRQFFSGSKQSMMYWSLTRLHRMHSTRLSPTVIPTTLPTRNRTAIHPQQQQQRLVTDGINRCSC